MNLIALGQSKFKSSELQSINIRTLPSTEHRQLAGIFRKSVTLRLQSLCNLDEDRNFAAPLRSWACPGVVRVFHVLIKGLCIAGSANIQNEIILSATNTGEQIGFSTSVRETGDKFVTRFSYAAERLAQ